MSAFFTCITASFFFSLLLVSMDTKTSVSLVLFSFTFYVYYYSFISLCIYIKSVLTNKTGIQRREKKKKKKSNFIAINCLATFVLWLLYFLNC